MKTPREILAEHKINYVETKKGTYTTSCPSCNGGYLNVKIDRKGACWYCRDCQLSGPQKKDKGGGDLGPIKAVFDYTNEIGERLFQVLKFEPLNSPKDFRQRTGPDQKKWSVKGVRIVPYRLPELIADIADEHVIFVAEGEKDVDTLRKHGVPATCNPMGAGKWWSEFNDILRDADVVICGDNDQPGRDHVQLVAKNLHGNARRLRMLDLATVWPGIEESDDITAWFESGGTVEQLWELVEQLPDWAPTTNGHDDAPPWELADKAQEEEVSTETLHWHGEVDPNDSRPALVQDLIPEIGSGLISGQWGTYKTFTTFDLAHAIMTGEPFLGFGVVRRGGILFIALEGANEVAIRLQGIEHKGKITGRAPFAWVETCPPLLDKNAAVILSKLAEQAAARLKAEFDLPLSMIIVDTVMAGAGFTKDGQENDAASSQAVMRTLAQVARNAKCFVFGVDHFGKDVSTGTRGSSAKEASADVVLALLGDKDVAGVVANTRLAIRKRRGGANGQEFPFKPRVVDMGVDKLGAQINTLVIDWGVTDDAPKKAKDQWSAKSLKLLRQTIMRLMVDCGKEIRPWADGPTVRALDVELVKREFYKSYLAEGGSEKAKRDARWRAFKRASDDAQGKGLIAVRELEGITYLWLADLNEHD